MKTHILVAAGLLFAGGAAAQGQAPVQQPQAPVQQPQAPAQQHLPAAQAQRTPAQGAVVIHLSEFGRNYHGVQMALSLANALQARGTPTTLLLDVDGVHLADRGTPLSISQLHAEGGQPVAAGQGQQNEIQPVVGGGGEGDTLEAIYQQFVSAGGQVLVRQHCASLAGLERGRLRQGARLVNDREIADVVGNADRVIDY